MDPVLGAHRLPLRESAARAESGVLLKSTGRTLWLEAPAPRITELGAYRLGGVAELVGAARDATPVAWGLPDQPGSKRASRRAPMALRTARLAAADQGNGRRRCPQAHQTIMPDGQHINHSAGGADSRNGRRLQSQPRVHPKLTSSQHRVHALTALRFPWVPPTSVQKIAILRFISGHLPLYFTEMGCFGRQVSTFSSSVADFLDTCPRMVGKSVVDVPRSGTPTAL